MKRTPPDLAVRVREEIESIRATVPRLGTVEQIRAVESIRRLESDLADLVALRQQSAMAKGKPVPTEAIVVAAPAPRRAAVPPAVRTATVRTATPAAQPDPWAAQLDRCYTAAVHVYAALVQSREDGLDP